MLRLHNSLGPAKAALIVAAALIASAAASGAFAQDGPPLVYGVENSGASFAQPVFPDFAHLPIVRPLTDPFRSFDGTRDTSFASWEKRRNEIKASIERYEIGPKPDCSDCAISATYVPAVAPARGTLTVVVTRNGKSLSLTSGVYIPSAM